MLAPLGRLECASDAGAVAIHGLSVFNCARVRDAMGPSLVPMSESEALGVGEDVMKPEHKKERWHC